MIFYISKMSVMNEGKLLPVPRNNINNMCYSLFDLVGRPKWYTMRGVVASSSANKGWDSVNEIVGLLRSISGFLMVPLNLNQGYAY